MRWTGVAIELFNETGAIDYSVDMARKLVIDGQKYLKIIKPSEAKKNLIDFSRFLVERKF